jgi:hypothetical protein
MSNSIIEKAFQDLTTSGYKITSPKSNIYNCIAWATGSADRWWWPDPNYQYHWPVNIPRTNKLESFIKAFEYLGYEVSTNENHEEGFEKVALFTKEDKPTHAAKQLGTGHWTSKLGTQEDIEHFDLKSIEGKQYGKVDVILKRQIK